jgi:hypothetical protein
MGAISAGLTGASIGGRMAGQFGQGDIAGGVTTAAQTVRGITQSIEDRELYGYSPTPQERAAYAKSLAEVGLTPQQAAMAARATGGTIQGVIYSAQAADADDKNLRDMLTKVGWTGSLDEFDTLVERHPSGTRQGAFLDLYVQKGMRDAQTAGQEAYLRKLSGLHAEQDYFASLAGPMKRKTAARDVNERDQRIADVTEALQTGEMNLQQASAELDKIAAIQPRVTYSPDEPSVAQRRDNDFSIGQLPMPDGSMSPPILFRRGRRTTENPDGEMHVERWIADEDPAKVILEHQASVTKSGLVTPKQYTVEMAAADYVKAVEIGKQIAAGTFQTKGVQTPVAVPQQPTAPAPPGPTAAGPVAAAPTVADPNLQSQVNEATHVLSKLMLDYPDAHKWAPIRERFHQHAVLLNKVFIEKIESGELLTPEQQQLAKFAAQIIRQGT